MFIKIIKYLQLLFYVLFLTGGALFLIIGISGAGVYYPDFFVPYAIKIVVFTLLCGSALGILVIVEHLYNKINSA